MGDYDYDDDPLYHYGDRKHGVVTSRDLLLNYFFPGDRGFTGGYAGKIYLLWLLVVGITINFCLWWFVAQWPFTVTIILTWIEAGLVLIGAIALTVMAVMSDQDVLKLTHGTPEVSFRSLSNAKRSRANAATDLSLLLAGLLFLLFEVSMVMMYWLGATGDLWLNGHKEAVNRVITNTTNFPTLTAAHVQQWSYRSQIHFFIFIKALILFTAAIFTRSEALALRVDLLNADRKRQGTRASDAPPDTAAHWAAPTQNIAMQPLMSGSSIVSSYASGITVQ